jgi:hypothetical protein
MLAMENYTIRPEGAEWMLTGEGQDRTVCRFTSKKQAIRRCLELVQNRPHSIMFQSAAGNVEEVRIYPLPEGPHQIPPA